MNEQDREALARTIWETSRADEGTISYLGANIIANALAPVVEQIAERRAAEAWDEGYRSGFSNAMRRMSDEPDAPTTPNPYCRCGTLTDLGGPGPHHDDWCPLDRAALDGR